MAAVKMLFSLLFIGALVLSSTAESEVRNEEDDGPIEIDPEEERAVFATGTTATLECEDTVNGTMVIWINPNGTDIRELNSSRVYYNDEGELSIEEIRLSDAGVYTCQTADGKHEEEIKIKVYIMPDYFFEGMIILITNCVLIVLFLGCWVYSYFKQKTYLKTLKQDKIDNYAKKKMLAHVV